MTRRWPLLALAACLAAAAAAQPDVVLIVADDLGVGDVGYDGAEILTPNLDALAAEGVVLDRFYTAGLCSPSRAGLLTGRYGVRMGINEPVTWRDTVGLPLGEVTLADRLGAAGYETAAVGKWHLGAGCEAHPLRRGFDRFVGLIGGGASYFTRRTAVGLDWWRGFEPEDVPGYTTDLIADEAVAILQEPRAGPLFLYLPFTAPHTPTHALAEDLALYPGLEEPRRTYAAMVTALDRAVGRVMDVVRASGRPTLVWFLSDNGAIERHGGSNGPLRGGKGTAHEGGLRAPSVVWYPPWGSRRVAHPVWYLDVFPTVLGVAAGPGGARPSRGASRPGGTPLAAPLGGLPLDGADQGPQLAGAPPTAALLDRVLLTYRRPYRRRGDSEYWFGAQTAEWKFVEDRSGLLPARALFQVGADPAETVDRSREQPGRLEALARRAYAFAALTLPGAAHDPSLTENVPADYSACGPGVAGPVRARLGALAVRAVGGAGRVVVEGAAGAVRVEAFDAVGRRVAVLHDGPARGRLDLRLAGVAPGAYVVRAVGGAGVASARVVVAR